jgi:hypothetical protein
MQESYMIILSFQLFLESFVVSLFSLFNLFIERFHYRGLYFLIMATKLSSRSLLIYILECVSYLHVTEENGQFTSDLVQTIAIRKLFAPDSSHSTETCRERTL